MRIRLCARLASALNLFATGRPGWRIPVRVVASSGSGTIIAHILSQIFRH